MELHSGHLVTILKVSNKSGQKALLHSYFHLCNFVLLKYSIDRLAEFFKRRKKAIWAMTTTNELTKKETFTKT